MIAYRHADRRYPFLWEGPGQPPARWNDVDDPPTHYFSDTPDGAWAEFLRHEGITQPADLETIQRTVWAVELPPGGLVASALPRRTLTGGASSYRACRAEAARLRGQGAPGLVAAAAALRAGGAAGWRVEGGLRRAEPREGKTIVLFGPRPDLVGWKACDAGQPGAELLQQVRGVPRG